jgi:predicted NAD-dependent protein-ADP-ribosyltransferase YbiA (DUF1768 family)
MPPTRSIYIDENTIYGELSNYASTPFNDGVYAYKSSLHAYYAYLNCQNIKNILASKTQGELQEMLGFSTYKNASTVLYHKKYYNLETTVEVIRAILERKVLQNPSVKQALLLTGDATLFVLNGSDMILGVGKSRRGLNLTGVLWMEIRNDLRKKDSLNMNQQIYSVLRHFRQPITYGDELNITTSTACSDPKIIRKWKQ